MMSVPLKRSLIAAAVLVALLLTNQQAFVEATKLSEQLAEYEPQSEPVYQRRSFSDSPDSSRTTGKEPNPENDFDSAASSMHSKDDPLQSILPKVKFNCKGRAEGYYADIDFDCEVFHYCKTNGFRFTFVCPPKSKFNQKQMTCDYEAADDVCSENKLHKLGAGKQSSSKSAHSDSLAEGSESKKSISKSPTKYTRNSIRRTSGGDLEVSKSGNSSRSNESASFDSSSAKQSGMQSGESSENAVYQFTGTSISDRYVSPQNALKATSPYPSLVPAIETTSASSVAAESSTAALEEAFKPIFRRVPANRVGSTSTTPSPSSSTTTSTASPASAPSGYSSVKVAYEPFQPITKAPAKVSTTTSASSSFIWNQAPDSFSSFKPSVIIPTRTRQNSDHRKKQATYESPFTQKQVASGEGTSETFLESPASITTAARLQEILSGNEVASASSSSSSDGSSTSGKSALPQLTSVSNSPTIQQFMASSHFDQPLGFESSQTQNGQDQSFAPFQPPRHVSSASSQHNTSASTQQASAQQAPTGNSKNPTSYTQEYQTIINHPVPNQNAEQNYFAPAPETMQQQLQNIQQQFNNPTPTNPLSSHKDAIPLVQQFQQLPAQIQAQIAQQLGLSPPTPASPISPIFPSQPSQSPPHYPAMIFPGPHGAGPFSMANFDSEESKPNEQPDFSGMFGLPRVPIGSNSNKDPSLLQFEQQIQQQLAPQNFQSMYSQMPMQPSNNAQTNSFMNDLNNVFSKHFTRQRRPQQSEHQFRLPIGNRPRPAASSNFPKFLPDQISSWFSRPKEMNGLMASSSHASFPSFADPPPMSFGHPPPPPSNGMSSAPRKTFFSQLRKVFQGSAPSASQSRPVHHVPHFSNPPLSVANFHEKGNMHGFANPGSQSLNHAFKPRQPVMVASPSNASVTHSANGPSAVPQISATTPANMSPNLAAPTFTPPTATTNYSSHQYSAQESKPRPVWVAPIRFREENKMKPAAQAAHPHHQQINHHQAQQAHQSKNSQGVRSKRQIFGLKDFESHPRLHSAFSTVYPIYSNNEFGNENFYLGSSSNLYDSMPFPTSTSYVSSPSSLYQTSSNRFPQGRDFPPGSPRNHLPNPFPTVPLQSWDSMQQAPAPLPRPPVSAQQHRAPRQKLHRQPIGLPMRLPTALPSQYPTSQSQQRPMTSFKFNPQSQSFYEPIFGSQIPLHLTYGDFPNLPDNLILNGKFLEQQKHSHQQPQQQMQSKPLHTYPSQIQSVQSKSPLNAKVVSYEYMYKPVSMSRPSHKRPPKRERLPVSLDQVSYEKINLPPISVDMSSFQPETHTQQQHQPQQQQHQPQQQQLPQLPQYQSPSNSYAKPPKVGMPARRPSYDLSTASLKHTATPMNANANQEFVSSLDDVITGFSSPNYANKPQTPVQTHSYEPTQQYAPKNYNQNQKQYDQNQKNYEENQKTFEQPKETEHHTQQQYETPHQSIESASQDYQGVQKERKQVNSLEQPRYSPPQEEPEHPVYQIHSYNQNQNLRTQQPVSTPSYDYDQYDVTTETVMERSTATPFKPRFVSPYKPTYTFSTEVNGKESSKKQSSNENNGVTKEYKDNGLPTSPPVYGQKLHASSSTVQNNKRQTTTQAPTTTTRTWKSWSNDNTEAPHTRSYSISTTRAPATTTRAPRTSWTYPTTYEDEENTNEDEFMPASTLAEALDRPDLPGFGAPTSQAPQIPTIKISTMPSVRTTTSTTTATSTTTSSPFRSLRNHPEYSDARGKGPTKPVFTSMDHFSDNEDLPGKASQDYSNVSLQPVYNHNDYTKSHESNAASDDDQLDDYGFEDDVEHIPKEVETTEAPKINPVSVFKVKKPDYTKYLTKHKSTTTTKRPSTQPIPNYSKPVSHAVTPATTSTTPSAEDSAPLKPSNFGSRLSTGAYRPTKKPSVSIRASFSTIATTLAPVTTQSETYRETSNLRDIQRNSASTYAQKIQPTSPPTTRMSTVGYSYKSASNRNRIRYQGFTTPTSTSTTTEAPTKSTTTTTTMRPTVRPTFVTAGTSLRGRDNWSSYSGNFKKLPSTSTTTTSTEGPKLFEGKLQNFQTLFDNVESEDEDALDEESSEESESGYESSRVTETETTSTSSTTSEAPATTSTSSTTTTEDSSSAAPFKKVFTAQNGGTLNARLTSQRVKLFSSKKRPDSGTSTTYTSSFYKTSTEKSV